MGGGGEGQRRQGWWLMWEIGMGDDDGDKCEVSVEGEEP